jgi:hypothetical protein
VENQIHGPQSMSGGLLGEPYRTLRSSNLLGARQKPKGGRMSLRAISAELATQGFLNENGRPFAAASIKSMLN